MVGGGCVVCMCGGGDDEDEEEVVVVGGVNTPCRAEGRGSLGPTDSDRVGGGVRGFGGKRY